MNKRRRVLGVMAALAWGLITALMAPRVATADAVCPPPPDTLAGLIAVDSDQGGPLTDQFHPVYGIYPEAAAAFWTGHEITVTAFVASPEGLGGRHPSRSSRPGSSLGGPVSCPQRTRSIPRSDP